MKTARPCTVWFTQWACCFPQSWRNILWKWFDRWEKLYLTVLQGFLSGTWLSAASEVLRHVPWQHLPARAQARARTSPNARGCFKLACAPRVSRRWESGVLRACVSKKEVILLQNWQAAEPLMRCIPKWNCWKWTLHTEEAGRKSQRCKIQVPPVYSSYSWGQQQHLIMGWAGLTFISHYIEFYQTRSTRSHTEITTRREHVWPACIRICSVAHELHMSLLKSGDCVTAEPQSEGINSMCSLWFSADTFK